LIIDSHYRYGGEILSEPTVIHVVDHHYDETNNVWPLQQLLDNSRVDPQSHTLLFDMNIHDDILSKYKPKCVPVFCAMQVDDFKNEQIEINWKNKNYKFNFMINKARPHRIKLLQMIHELAFKNFTYSLPWTENPFTSLPVTHYMIGTEKQMPQGIRSGQISNSKNYKQLLQKNVFEPSSISLITETVCIEREAHITEKTVMAIYGGTIPIWVGGWRCADAMRCLGFDVFEDIVDHSYQALEDPWQRVEKSIYLNQDLLSNFTISPEILTRLEYNLDLLLSGVFKKQVEQQLQEALDDSIPSLGSTIRMCCREGLPA
jgi:hypothetical protein